MTPPASGTFADVPATHWAYDYVERAAAEGAVTGTGNGLYDPDRDLTRTEFMIMMTRVFYPELVEDAKREWNDVNWYNVFCSAADKLDISDVSFYAECKSALDKKDNGALLNVCGKTISRTDMAVIAEAIMRNRGIEALSDTQKNAADAKIPDVGADTVNAYAIFAVVHHGIINGVDAVGTFNGSGTVTRASVAAIYCRLSDLLEGTEVTLTPKPTTTVTPGPTSTKKAPYATTDDSVVGTVSDSRVSLSLSTHTAPVDYYSRHPELNGIVDKDDYNAYVFTALNREWYVENGIIASYWGKSDDGTYGWTYGIDTFNYPCFDRKSELGLSATLPFTDYYISSITNGGMHINRVGDVDSDNIGVYKVTKRNLEDIYNGAFVPIFAKFTDGMTDKEKIVIMVEALCDKMTYADGSSDLENVPSAGASGWWASSASLIKGVCDDYAIMFADICKAAGIPCINTGGQVTTNINHAWNLVYADGEWLMVDVTAVDTGGFASYYTKEEGVKILGNDNGDFDCQAQLIIEALCEDIDW